MKDEKTQSKPKAPEKTPIEEAPAYPYDPDTGRYLDGPHPEPEETEKP